MREIDVLCFFAGLKQHAAKGQSLFRYVQPCSDLARKCREKAVCQGGRSSALDSLSATRRRAPSARVEGGGRSTCSVWIVPPALIREWRPGAERMVSGSRLDDGTKSHRQLFPGRNTFRILRAMKGPNEFRQRVLVAEDDLAIQQMVVTLLTRYGVNAEGVADGEAVLQRLRRFEYDAVLLDLMLPRTNGFEIIRHLKCLQPDLLSRVIVVTAASERTLEYLDHGDVRKVLRKPFDIGELVGEVRACMAERSAGGGTASGGQESPG